MDPIRRSEDLPDTRAAARPVTRLADGGLGVAWVAPAATAAPAAPPELADRGELVDALKLLLAGRVLVQLPGPAGGALLDGAPLRWSMPVLRHYGLVEAFDNPRGFAGLGYFRLTAPGRAFAHRLVAHWRALPWWLRVLVRFTG